jgi:hypothetical protein
MIAFPPYIKKELANISKYFHRETVHGNTCNLFSVNGDVSDKKFFAALKEVGMACEKKDDVENLFLRQPLFLFYCFKKYLLTVNSLLPGVYV